MSSSSVGVPDLTRVGNLLDGVAAVVARYPDRPAVRCGERQLSYRELDTAAMALAGAIQARGDAADHPVAILLERSTDMVVAVVAILRTGSSYLPVDPATPAARLSLIFEDAEPSLVITSRGLAEVLPPDVPVLYVDDPLPAAELAVPLVDEATRAYIIFTSGTTGRPKGVEVTHGNVLRLFTTTGPLFGFGPTDVWSLFHSFSFDFSVWEMWGALLYGGCVVVVPEQVAKDPATFWRLLHDEHVTVMSQTPTAFNQLVIEDARHAERLPLCRVVFGGEALRFSDLRRWVAKYGDDAPELTNMYGITETTVHASHRRVRAEDLDQDASLIGCPLPDLDFMLVDEQLAPVTAGEVGEIVVTGPGVARGYLRRPELTRERFIEVSRADGRLVRGYRSGDLAVRTPSGEYEYRGRRDDQVKIRGYRIELGEVRAVLSAAPGVLQVAVLVQRPETPANPITKQRATSTRITDVRDLVRGGGPGTTSGDRTAQIVAYLVAGEAFDAAQLFRHLREQLPPHLLPAFIVPVDTIPMNQSGKVDPTTLPRPTAFNRLRETSASASKGECGVRAVCALFEEVLDVRGVGEDDSFFSVGGDSILALRLRAEGLERGVDLSLADIYALRTPRALAAAGRDGTTVSEAVEPLSLISAEDRERLPATGVEDAYPLATLQAGLLFHSAYEAGANVYCDIFMFRLRAAYEHQAMAGAIARAVARHDLLRTSFHFAGFSEPLQLVHESARTPLTAIDLRHLDGAGQEAELAAWREKDMATGYDWSRPPLMRFTVHVLAHGEFLLSMSFHDALLDGWSEASLITELLTDYLALGTGQDKPAAPRPARRYADFVALERSVLRGDTARRFWAEELADAEPTLLPRLGAGSADVHDSRMGFLSVDVDDELSEALDQVARANDVALKQLLLAVHARALATLTARDDVVLGVESNGRVEDTGGADVIGVHLNVVPYRVRTRGRSWQELIKSAWEKENELLPVRRYPYAELQRQIGVRELTDISFNYTHFHSYSRLAAARDLEVLDAKAYIRTHFTLRVEFNTDPFTKLLNVDLEANLERVSEEQLRAIGELYHRALVSIAAHVQSVPTQRELLGESRWERLLPMIASTARPLSAAGFFELFERAVATHGTRRAARCGDADLTYEDLSRRVGELASRLWQAGVRPGTTVGLVAGRDLDFLTAVLAIMRTGAVYLPLPQGPALRVASMLRRSGARLVLCDRAAWATVEEAASEVPEKVSMVDLDGALVEAAALKPFTGPAPRCRDSAYVIFTSGSTGEPKGALTRHDGMLNHLEAKIESLELGQDDLVSQDAAATFDISVWQLLAPLVVGATTVIYPDELGQDPPRLLRAVAADGISVLEVTPAVLSVFTSELAYYGADAFPGVTLRWVVSSGETLTPKVANAFRSQLPAVRLLNMWGATEVSDDCTHYELIGEADERLASVPIGEPIANAVVYVLDDNGDPVPLGTPGELCVGGLCVGGGYLNDEKRTATAFVPDPFAGQPDAVMYRTGDRGHRGADGRLEFLGRLDTQLKVRGHRLELGEVRHAVAALDGVAESTVVVRELPDGTRQLAGFYVPATSTDNAVDGTGSVPRIDLRPDTVRAGLAKILPRYAIPDFLVALDALPRTPHAKIDTEVLENWDFADPAPGLDEEALPATVTEATVIEVWESVLGLDQVGAGTHFFDVGGHSLHATQVMARLRDHLGLDLPLRPLFEHPTVRELAAWIDGRRAESGPATAVSRRIGPRLEGAAEFPLTLNQSSLWFLGQLDADDGAYDNGALLRISGPLDVRALAVAVDHLAGRHEILSMRFGSRDGIPYQYGVPEAQVRLDVETVPDGADLCTDPDAMDSFVRQRMSGRRFDLERGPLVVARLYRFTPTEHILEWSSHHIVSDGWSTNIVMAEIREAYLARVEGREPRLSPLDAQYGDYARWQHEFIESAEGSAEAEFWCTYLDGYEGELDLVTDLVRTEGRSRVAAYASRTWDQSTTNRIVEFTAERRTTPFMLFHAVTALLMAKFSQQSDVVLGAAVAGRSLPETENLVGFFANTVPFRYSVDIEQTPDELLGSVTGSALTALEHPLLPFPEIVRVTGVQRRPGVSPLVQVVVTVDNYPLDLSGLPDLSTSLTQVAPPTSQFDLLLRFVIADSLELSVQYDSSLFLAGTVDRLLDAFGRLLEFFLRRPDRPMREAALLTEDERRALGSVWWEVTGSPLDVDHTMGPTVISSPRWTEFLDQVERRGLLPALLMAL